MYSREELDFIWNILDNIMNDGYIHGQDIRKLYGTVTGKVLTGEVIRREYPL